MKDPNIIQEKDFRYEIFKPSVRSDSGVLLLATKLTDESVQYVIKCQVEWNPVSEFIYHKITVALGINTVEVKLFKSLLESKYACGIRYCADAKLIIDINANDENHLDFFRFKALFQILDEEDSEEFYADEQNRLFKIDNAEAFLFSITFGLLIKKAKTKSQWVKMAIDEDIEKYANKLNTQYYSMMAERLLDAFGKDALKIYLDTFIKFAELGLTLLDEAFTSLDKVYPQTFSEYLRYFLEIRQSTCREFAEKYAV